MIKKLKQEITLLKRDNIDLKLIIEGQEKEKNLVLEYNQFLIEKLHQEKIEKDDHKEDKTEKNSKGEADYAEN